jgi:serine/threonine protein kinase
LTVEEASLLSWLEPVGEPRPGEEFQLNGKYYTFIKRLGEGAFGKTFHVVPNGGIDTVFKVFKHQSASLTTEIKKEFDRAKKLNLENCAKMHAILFDEDKTVGFSYEYIEGDTLEYLISKSKGDQISSSIKRDISLAVFGTLVELHKSRWVHKDIKPANLVVLPDERGVCLIDFGLLTQNGRGTRMGAGTPEYMAPEAVGLVAADFSLDLYGACASLLELFIGRKTFDGCFTKDSPNSPFVFQGLAASDVERLDPLGRNLARQLAKGLAFSPLDRPRSATDVIDLLLQADDRVEPEGVEVISSAVTGLLRQRRGSIGVLPPSDEFAERTQVTTQLETVLIPQLLEGRFDAIFLSGNPGDGKTTFLNTFRDHLLNRGGQVQKETASGWIIKRQNLTFHALLDASESEGSIPSDERITQTLSNLEVKDNVVLLAINDGRIDSFMRSYSDQFIFATDVQNQLAGLPPKNPRIIVVDLKLRALIRPDNGESSGLALQVLETLTDPALWTECEKCISREVCPILDNKTRVRRESALAGFEQLLAISHYRREQRATFRDVRSVFAYVITADLDCEAVHEARRDGRDLRRAENTLFFDLAFAGSGGDHLFESWKLVDPERLPLSQAARRLAHHATGDSRALRFIICEGGIFRR